MITPQVFRQRASELLRQIKLHQEAPQQPEETAISMASASNNCQPYKGDPFPAFSICIFSLAARASEFPDVIGLWGKRVDVIGESRAISGHLMP